jgi:hypothetical protein
MCPEHSFVKKDLSGTRVCKFVVLTDLQSSR